MAIYKKIKGPRVRRKGAMTGKRVITIALCAVLVVGGLIAIVAELGFFAPKIPPLDDASFVDEDSGQVVKVPWSSIPPIISSAGKSLVRGVFYSWDNCQTKKLVYLEKFTPEVREMLAQGKTPLDATNAPDPLAGLMVRLPEAGSPWLAAKSAEGKRMVEQANRQGDVEGCPCFR